MKSNLPISVLLASCIISLTFAAPLDYARSVVSIPYVLSFNPDRFDKQLGCDMKVAYSSFTYPDGYRDAAHIFLNSNSFGSVRCQPKQVYFKLFGYAQNYETINNANQVAQVVKRSMNGAVRNLIIDWKYNLNSLAGLSLLDNIIKELESAATVYIKVPASELCKQVQGKPYILSLQNAKKIIVEMYGQQPAAYKNAYDIFTAETSVQMREGYPNPKCPKFPSYNQLKTNYPQFDFFIEKTLQQEEHGFLGEEFNKMLSSAAGVYDKIVFYDAFPRNVIRI